ncbi:MAG: methyltransferase domain-containing protein [Treponema sp.]|uniref:cytidylyltransferase domain-containing protein n=1 Tax=Treponema sp. TaxID=166 RepID=UPI0025F6B20C|nr:methyltransferase domain-containing protein [Treponema sp.]MBQ9281208.1 methyltransferase domain-containing protein [Treponema sp.]
MTIIAVQCRLSSTRLPSKALLPLGGKTVLDWTLSAMKKVKADDYYVATDSSSYEALKPVCERNGFKIFEGPLEDVLARYCALIEESNCDVVLRATADNPFLFYEAAQSLLDEFESRSKNEDFDYITYTGLPHGSGIEVFKAASLLKARALTNLAYDHEHVGPSLYNHPEHFKSLFLPSPAQWYYPSLRTTIDTITDYKRAESAVKIISGSVSEQEPVKEPYTTEQILSAFESPDLYRPILTVPCVKKGKGTGHLRRCLKIALETGANVYIGEDAGLEEKDELIEDAKKNGLSDEQIVSHLPEKNEYELIVTDAFTLDRELALQLSKAAPLLAIDEGSLNANLCDCLLDIIPSYGLERPANFSDPSFVSLPEHRRSAKKPENFDEIKSVLVTVGGEDPGDLVVPSAIAFAASGKKITAIVQSPEEAELRVPEDIRKKISFIRPVHNLKEQLSSYDVVVTHYGFTAFEALAAGCGVILLGTTPLHVNLAQKYGFASLSQPQISSDNALSYLKNISSLYPDSPFIKEGAGKKSLGDFIKLLSCGKRNPCPVCRDDDASHENPIVARTSLHTFRRCKTCGMLYMSWTHASDKNYNSYYFFEDYKKQYGKTYLDDFKNIKKQCVRRTSVVDMLYRSDHKAVTPAVLDIGCAFGPYLDAANDAGWQVFGTDISKEAVDYVQNSLHYPAAVASFPDFDPVSEFGVKNFDAVTMWYVIEHFQDLDSVLRGVSKILKNGGIFAFSTPSASGVSGRFNTQSFFQNSPTDHFTLWEPGRAASILKRYGFKVCKMVSTGHHPERFPNLKGQKSTSLKFALYSTASHFFGLGDTFEVYCKKEKDC